MGKKSAMVSPVQTMTPLVAARNLSTSLEALDIPMSADLFDQIAGAIEGEGARFELINGRMVEKGMPTQLHGGIALNIGAPIRFWLKKNPIGRGGTEVRHQVSGDNDSVLMPDVSVLLEDVNQPVVAKGAVPRLPEFVVEIESPDDDIDEMRQKAALYLDNGTLLMWIVRPKPQEVEVHRPGVQPLILKVGDTLSGYDVLPGFELAVADVFDV